jgi:hypothetical protein
MKKIIYSYLLIISALFIISCEKEIDFTGEIKDSKIVVNSLFSTDSTWSVEISKSLSIIDIAKLDVIRDATATITGSDGSQLTLTFNPFTEKYETNEYPKVNVEYTIKVSAPGYESVSASGSVYPTVPLQDIEIKKSSVVDDPYSQLIEIRITFDDPPSSTDYYMVELEEKEIFYLLDPNQQVIDSIISIFSSYISSNDLSISGESSSERLIFSDELFDGQRKTFVFQTTGYFYDEEEEEEPEIEIERMQKIIFSKINRDYYLYEFSFRNYQNTVGNPFAEPVMVYSNIEGGFGIFAGKNSDTYEYELK